MKGKIEPEQRFLHTTFYSGRSRRNIRLRGTLQAEGSIAGPRTQASEAPLFTRIWYHIIPLSADDCAFVGWRNRTALTEVTGDTEDLFLRVPCDLCERFC